MSRFLRILIFNLKTETKFKFDYVVRIFVYCFRIFVFNELWDYLLKDKMVLGYTRETLIWYVIVGEAIIYSMSKNYIKISNMVKTGDIANILVKPINILEYLFLMEFTSIINLVSNFGFAVIFGILYLGIPQISVPNFVLFVIAILISYFMILTIQILVGILAFFFEENEPFYLIISKAILIITMTPVEFYSGFTYKLMAILPTTYVIYTPAKIFLNCDINLGLHLIIYQIVSCIFLSGILFFLTKKGVEKINVNGG